MNELLREIKRLRPHYQSLTATDAGRRQMLDHFETFIKQEIGEVKVEPYTHSVAP